MSSIIPGHNYDIFISYRQKDNKGDGWVSEFVEALKTELESTFKEEISVYFDINPHDGLLETHDVDESLKEKLKCLIFIPIISRTYCDPKAFAWEHEFKAFVDQASKDEFGLKVKLPNGNVASRVLPIVTYDLDKQDIKLCESLLGGALRGVKFIYKEPGVNRPLRSNEEKPHENLNNTIYRNQVNKVANTIKDVLNSLAKREQPIDEGIPEPEIIDEKIGVKKPIKKKPREIPSVSLLYRLKHLTRLTFSTWRIIALVLLIVSIGVTWLYMSKKPPPTDRAALRSDIPLNNMLSFPVRKALALSPDGEYLVYSMNGELNLKQLNGDTPSELIHGTDIFSSGPFFSPDGTWIGFLSSEESKIMKIPLTGGNPVAICDVEETFNEGNWYENEIIYADRSAIYRVPDSGGTPELLYPLNRSDNDPVLWNPQLLPDKKTLLFSQKLEDGVWSIVTWRLGSQESPDVIVERGHDAIYLKSGHIAYTLNNRLYIRKFNLKTNRVISEPQIITTNPVYESMFPAYGASQFDFSENGILVYYEQQDDLASYNLVWVDESGNVSPPINKEAKRYGYTTISSDSQNIAASFMRIEGSIPKYQIEIIDIKTGNGKLFAEDAAGPVWSADNSFIYYTRYSTNNQVLQKLADGSKSPELLFELDSALNCGLFDLSSDGRYLLFDANFGSGFDIGYYDMINNKVEMLEPYNTEGDEIRPNISPDNKWLAYFSNQEGHGAIYVAPFPGPGLKTKVSVGQSLILYYSSPKWSPDMTALYYETIDPDFELWKVKAQDSENNFSFEPAQSIFNGGNDFAGYENGGDNYIEIHPNGDRFLVNQKEESVTEEAIEPRIKVIVNWEQELEGN